MNFPFVSSTVTPLRSSTVYCFHTNPKTPIPRPLRRTNIAFPVIPARDRVIDFGKYKGKMLGTLPSTYLKWVSKNLRAQDFEEWAKLCDEVLIDPVYKDRIEWEFAEKILNGDVLSNSSVPANGNQNAASELLEMSQRFGWDNEDKAGWSKIDFGLLGSSKGGRIPRIGDEIRSVEKKMQKLKKNEEISDEGDGERRRRARRERLKSKSRTIPTAAERMRKLRILDDKKEFVANQQEEEEGKSISPFPGREALLKKIMNNG
ncbi:uncharacterized protein LOC111405416 [Olea europaea var. sylvestris]|uniref:uncharacterized protein LOC111405416 n=1 Tax=Olea europaea var. sylvestris TaxID=158386 RepID=UPI000C1D5478|nr:uncharacterized protein LOC111405416 [Olea europaea var. sylvestris]